MLTLLRNKITIIVASLVLASAALFVPAMAFAADPNISGSLGCGSDLQVSIDGDCTTEVTAGADEIQDIVTLIINVISVIVGIVAVIMIIWGGFKYITAGGDSGNVTTARNTIIYAIVGLVIVALAQFIVQFVLKQLIGE
jgi:hypothetical protein